jgi:predicted amidophosphoribosyltransferase
VSLNAGQPLGGNLLLMAIGPYEGRWRQEIRQFKFHGDIELGRAMGHVLWSRIVRRFTAEQRTVPKASDWVIIGAPSSPSRNAGRGFEPGEILAQGLSLASGISVQSGFLRRLEGLAQRDAPARNRVENAQLIQPACDQWTHWPDWAKCVILVDDVATTMASMHRMADILYASGIETVVGAVAGRTPLTLVDPPA